MRARLASPVVKPWPLMLLALAGCGPATPSPESTVAPDRPLEPRVLFVPQFDGGSLAFQTYDVRGAPQVDLTSKVDLTDDDEAIRLTVEGQVYDTRPPALGTRLQFYVDNPARPDPP